MATTRIPDPMAEPEAEAVRKCVDRILSSPEFAPAPRLAAFLRFIVEESLQGRADSLKETSVAIQVFGRLSDFDPRFDSVVRAQGTQLRRRLRSYYAEQGREDAVVIDVPPGSYVPVFHRRVAESRGPAQATRQSWRSVAMVAGLLLIVVLAAWWLSAGWRRQVPSLAILPFLNLDGGSEHVSDGMVEDLTTELAEMPGLRVVARTSAFQFRGKSGDVRQIGRDLGAEAILEGSVRTEAGKIRVTAQLVDARNGYHLWSGSFEREFGQLREVEFEIRGAVGKALGVQRTAAPTRASSHVPPAEALDAYWRGRHVLADWERFPESLPYFEQATRLDPSFAEAWAALATVHAGRAFQEVGSAEKEAAKAKEAARRALELDETLAEAHTALAQVQYEYDRDWNSSEQSYRRALQLNPNSAGVRRAYALALTSRARFHEAIVQLKLARETDPLTLLTTNILAVTLFCARRYDDAISEVRRHIRMDPEFHLARATLGSCLAEKGDLAGAISEYQRVLQHSHPVEVVGRLGNAQARAGRLSDARATLAELERIQQTDRIASVALARVTVGLGENRRAIEWLEEAAADHLTDVAFIGVDPIFDPLRREPAFLALCARLGLPSHP